MKVSVDFLSVKCVVPVSSSCVRSTPQHPSSPFNFHVFHVVMDLVRQILKYTHRQDAHRHILSNTCMRMNIDCTYHEF